jgi:hypothetical protein
MLPQVADGAKPWTETEIADLKDGVESGLSMSEMVEFFARCAAEIQQQITASGFEPGAEVVS